MTETDTHTTDTAPADAGSATETAVCGQAYDTPTGKHKVCVKPSGHKGTHSDRVVTTKEYKPVNSAVFGTYEAVPGDEVVEYGGGKREGERSDEQRQVDAHVKDAHESWVIAGRPKAFNDMPRKRYFMKPDDVDTVKFMLRRAARLHGVAVRIAAPKAHKRGQVMLYWAATDPTPRDKSNGSADGESNG